MMSRAAFAPSGSCRGVARVSPSGWCCGLALAAALCGCASDGPSFERGAECIDGKDNDRDGLIDCSDPDCATLAICGAVDSGVRDLAAPIDAPGADLPAADARPDLARDLRPDLPSGTGYGTRCTWRGRVETCDDATSFCVLDKDGQGAFCTQPCVPNGLPCAAGPGQRAECIYVFNSQPVCFFVCDYLGGSYDCPADLECVGLFGMSSQRECHP